MGSDGEGLTSFYKGLAALIPGKQPIEESEEDEDEE
jgi:hypothetical protein